MILCNQCENYCKQTQYKDEKEVLIVTEICLKSRMKFGSKTLRDKATGSPKVDCNVPDMIKKEEKKSEPVIQKKVIGNGVYPIRDESE